MQAVATAAPVTVTATKRPANDQVAAQRYVVEHQGLGSWKRGDVISGSMIMEAGGDVARLIANRAMREATLLEAGLEHVDLPSVENALSYQSQLDAKDQQIARLQQRVSDLEEEKAARHASQAASMHPAAPQESRLVEEKDAVIRELQAKIREQQTVIAEKDRAIQQAPKGGRGNKLDGPPQPG
jgi:predicted RNase H-like nuclease (RuvC/YqgF family)